MGFLLDFNHVDNSSGTLELPFLGEVLWPPYKSYAISFWMKIEPKLGRQNSDYTINLASFECAQPDSVIKLLGPFNLLAPPSPNTSCEQHCAFNRKIESGFLAIYCGEEKAIFQEWLREGRWYFVTLNHVRSKARTAKRTKGKICLWLDGIPKGELNLAYPTSQNAYGKVILNSPHHLHHHSGKQATHSWNLGPLHLFSDFSFTSRECEPYSHYLPFSPS